MNKLFYGRMDGKTTQNIGTIYLQETTPNIRGFTYIRHAKQIPYSKNFQAINKEKKISLVIGCVR